MMIGLCELNWGGCHEGDSSEPMPALTLGQGVEQNFLTVTDFGGLDVGIPQAMRRSIDFAANSHGIGAG